MTNKRGLAAWLVGVVVLIGATQFENAAMANCGPGTFLTDKSEPYRCGTNEDNTPLWGTRAFCYIQSCNEDAVPANRGSCWQHIWCPGEPSRPGACAEAINASAEIGVEICPFTVTTACRQTCDEICGNGEDDNGNGRIDEGCTCTGSEAGCCEGQMGHPVALESGGVTTDPLEDLSLPTPGIPVTIERIWISTSAADVVSPGAGFGKRWHSNLEERLIPAGTSMLWYRPDGRTVSVPLQSGSSPDGFSTRMVADVDGYRLISTDGITTFFDLAGRLRKRLQNGHGLAGVSYSDETARPDCPSDGKLRICELHDSRGTEIRLSWTNELVTAITVAPETPDAWTIQYHYDDVEKMLISVSSSLRTVSYGYSDQTEIKRNLVSVSVVPGAGQAPLLLEHHDWYDKQFPPSVRGRSRVSIGRNSALAFRWGACDIFAGPGQYCKIGTQDGPEERVVSTFDLRATDRDVGQPCTSDANCPANTACVFMGTLSPGGLCKSMDAADTVYLKNGRVVSRTVGCATCNGEPSITWDESTGVKKATQSDTGRNTSYQYDANGRLMRTIENDTDSDPTTVPNDKTYRLTDLTYDPGTGRVGVVTETSNLVSDGYRTRTFSYNASGLVESLTLAGYTRREETITSRTISTRKTTFGYQNGLLTSVDGPRSDVSDVLTIEYFSSDAPAANDRLRLRRMCRETGNAARATLCTEFSNYDLWGNARQLVDPDGVTSALTYDSSGRLSTLVRDVSNPGSSLGITYDGAGNVSTFKEESGRCRQYAFGDFGALKRVTWRGDCDASSEILREDIFGVDQVGRLISAQTIVAGNVVSDLQFTYDGRGRFGKVAKLSIPGSPSQILTRTSLGFVSKSENEDCWPVRLPTCFSESYESSGQDDSLSTIVDAVSNERTSFSYDRDGHPRLIYTPGGVSSSYEFDDFGLLTATSSNETEQGLFQTYNEGGQLVAQFDNTNLVPLQRVTRDYLGRLIRVVYGAPVTCTSADDGKLLGEKRYSYDIAPTGSKWPSGGYLAGRPARIEVDQQCDSSSPSGRMTLVTDYGYSPIGLPTDVVEHSTSGFPTEFGSAVTPLATHYRYRPDGQVDRVTFPDGDVFNYDFDAQGRPTGLRGTDDGIEKPLISAAQYQDPVTGTLASWTNHVSLGGQP